MSNKNFNINGSLLLKDLTLTGNLNVKGFTNTVNQETLTIKDNIIVTNADGSAVLDAGVVAVTGNQICVLKEGDYSAVIRDYFNFNKLKLKDIEGSILSLDQESKMDYENFDHYAILRLYAGNNILGEWEIWPNNPYDPVIPLSLCKQIIDDDKIEMLKETITTIKDSDFSYREEAYAAPLYVSSENVLKIGRGSIARDSNNNVSEFTFFTGEDQAIATRNNSINNGNIIVWDDNNKSLSDGGVAISDLNLNLKNSDGEKSLTLEQTSDSVSYTTSPNYAFERIGTGAFGTCSTNLSTKGRVSANNFLNIGNLNVVECDLSEADDGGILAGYKLYSNSRGTSLFGAWNRTINSIQSAAFGYRNTLIDSNKGAIVSGQNNFVYGKGTNVTFGHGLRNKWSYATVLGRNNDETWINGLKDLPSGDPLKTAEPLLIVGNGNASPDYEMVYKQIKDTGMAVTQLVAHNEKYKENPLGEDLYFSQALLDTKTGNYNKFSWNDLILNEDNLTSETYVYHRTITNRSNALVLLSNSRLFLPRKSLSYKNSLRDNEVPTKGEIEERLHDLDFLSYSITPSSAIVADNIYSDTFVSNVKQSKGQIEITTNNKLRRLKVYESPEHSYDVIRKQDLDSTKTELTTRIDALETTVQQLSNIIESLNIS